MDGVEGCGYQKCKSDYFLDPFLDWTRGDTEEEEHIRLEKEMELDEEKTIDLLVQKNLSSNIKNAIGSPFDTQSITCSVH